MAPLGRIVAEVAVQSTAADARVATAGSTYTPPHLIDSQAASPECLQGQFRTTRSGEEESNSCRELGALTHYHCAITANRQARQGGWERAAPRSPPGSAAPSVEWNRFTITQPVRPDGAPGENRTPPHLIDSQAASPEAYRGKGAARRTRLRAADAGVPSGIRTRVP